MNPLTSSKYELFQEGVRLCTKFITENIRFAKEIGEEEIPPCKFFTYDEAENRRLISRLERQRKIGMLTGFYYNNVVYVNVKKTAKPVANPARTNWSFPGYKIDRTAVGVVAHELGHHIDAHRKFDYHKWKAVLKISKKISGYEPNPNEALAESIRLLILNPNLLALGSPELYNFLVSELKLYVVSAVTFQNVLNHPAYIAQAEKWIAK
jgi:hypothetical protein